MSDQLSQLAVCHGTETAFHVLSSSRLDLDLRKQVSFPLLETSVLFRIEKRNSKGDLWGLIMKITISSIAIGLKNSYFPLIHFSSYYRRAFHRTVQ